MEESRAYWDRRAPTFAGHCGQGAYVEGFLRRLALRGDESILDMGCGSGTFAVPLARAGHKALACDFSEKMIEQVRLRADAEGLDIASQVMAWEDDWTRFGLDENCVDVAIASRSIGMSDLADCLRKLDWVARERVAVTVSAGMAPARDESLRAALGRAGEKPRAVIDVLEQLGEMGRFGEVSYLSHRRPMHFADRDEGLAELRRMAGQEPFTSQEEQAFEAYVAAHYVQGECDGETFWELDYPLIVTWALVIWKTDGSI